MLEAVQKGWFSNDYRLRSRGGIIAHLRVSSLRTRADLDMGSECYRFYRDGLLAGAFLLEQNGSVLARAEKPGILRSRFTVEFGGRKYDLAKSSVWTKNFVLHEDGKQIGTLRRRGFLIRRVRLDFPRAWPVAAQAFIFWLALVVWRREDAIAAGS